MKKVLLTATVQSHIAQFHKPLINMLKQNGYEVHVAARDNLAEKNGLKLNEPDKVFNIPFNRSPLSKSNVVAYKQLKQIINNTSYDVIHCNTPIGGIISRLAAKRARKKGTKVFYTAHGFHFYKGAPKKNWMVYYPIEKWFARYTDKLITITKEDYELAKKRFNTKVYHVHGVGANASRFFPYETDDIIKLRSEFGYTKDQLLLLCIGELNKNKNQSIVIKSMIKVKKEIPEAKLILAGNGPMENELKDLVDKLNLKDNVKFLGYTIDLEKYINICNVVISASYREGLPLNIMEAMLCGKPVIVSKNRGHMELVKNQVTGYILDHFDADLVSLLIIKLSQRKEIRVKLGTNGIKLVEPFIINNVLEELKIIYNLE